MSKEADEFLDNLPDPAALTTESVVKMHNRMRAISLDDWDEVRRDRRILDWVSGGKWISEEQPNRYALTSGVPMWCVTCGAEVLFPHERTHEVAEKEK